MTPLTKAQWKSVVLNAVLAFFATALPTLVYSTSWDKAAVSGAVVAGFMSAFKIIEKAFKTE
jgi:hypothetical protein